MGTPSDVAPVTLLAQAERMTAGRFASGAGA